MKILYKLILGFLVIALLIWVVGYFAVDRSQEVLKKTIGNKSVSLATEIVHEIDTNIHRRIETFQDYSNDLILQEFLLKSNQVFQKLDNIQA